MHFINCKRIRQQAKSSVTVLLKALQKQAALREVRIFLAESANGKQNSHKLVGNGGIRLHLRNPLTLCNSEQLPIFARCGIDDKTNVPTKFTLQLFVRGVQGKL